MQKKTVILFPKGKTPVLGTFSIDFYDVAMGKKAVTGRYPIQDIANNDTYRDMLDSMKDKFKKSTMIVPGIRTRLVKTENGNEFIVSVDYDKAKSLFFSAEQLNWKSESILSMEQIRMLIKAHLKRMGAAI